MLTAKPKADVISLNNSGYPAKTEFNNCFIIQRYCYVVTLIYENKITNFRAFVILCAVIFWAHANSAGADRYRYLEKSGPPTDKTMSTKKK